MASLSLRGPFTVALDESEWRLVCALREIPPSPLRDRMTWLIRDLVAFVANPGCPEVQADGVPCDDAHMSCDRCSQMTGLLEALHARLRER